jgi:hypothetical protein
MGTDDTADDSSARGVTAALQVDSAIIEPRGTERSCYRRRRDQEGYAEGLGMRRDYVQVRRTKGGSASDSVRRAEPGSAGFRRRRLCCRRPVSQLRTTAECKGILRRVFVDESHLTFTASDWRPKLAEVRAVRGLKVPTIMLTATLPVLLEFELEVSMAAQMARYTRAGTTRVKTRYMVERCKPGTLEEGAIQLCRRVKKHLGMRKGVVYSRSRTQCEDLAKEL